MRHDEDVSDGDGHPLQYYLGRETMKLPGRMGYGIAIVEPGRVLPYLLATSGQPLTSIKELKNFGFRSVIDLTASTSTAALHRSETRMVGMQYFNIPIEGDMPTRKQTELFYRIVINANNGPLLVYGPTAESLGVMWVSYRLHLGSPLEFVFREGRTLGLTKEQETEMRFREQRSSTKKEKD